MDAVKDWGDRYIKDTFRTKPKTWGDWRNGHQGTKNLVHFNKWVK